MTFARTVRLLVGLVFAVSAFTWPPSLLAQGPRDVRQYVPGRDVDVSSYPGDVGRGQAVPAYVSVVDGSAQLQRAGEVVRDFEQVPLEVGDRLSTDRGRVEVLFTDGGVFALDEYTDITIDSETSWRLHGGRVKVVLRSPAFELHAVPAGVARLWADGDYTITLTENGRGEAEVELAVSRGSGELANTLGRTLVREGTRALTTAAFAPSVPYAYAAPRDDFERWAASLEADRYGAESAQYLPVELRTYGGTFDQYGSWSRYGSYGWVWYPRVSVGWQPYRSGRWSFVVNFGYNWIGGSRWEWPTHHYGRWDRAGSRWFWVPERRVQGRRVGYAAPRRSVSTAVVYYTRPTPTRQVAVSRDTRNNTGRLTSRQGAIPRDTSSNTGQPAVRQVPILRGSGSNTGRSTAGQRPPTVQQPRAVSRNPTASAPQTRQIPSVTRQAPSAPSSNSSSVRSSTARRQSVAPGARAGGSSRQTSSARQAPSQARQGSSSSAARQAPSRARQAPSSSRPTQSARPSQPQRSAPSARPPSRSAPKTGSRTPSSSRSSAKPPSGSTGRSGTAVRRRGGGG